MEESTRWRRFSLETPPGGLVDVAYQRPAPERIELRIDAGRAPAVVFVSESFHPWWVARVDSRLARVHRAQSAFMAVRVGPGEHRIELRLVRPRAVVFADRATRVAWTLLLAGLPPVGVAVWWRSRSAARHT